MLRKSIPFILGILFLFNASYAFSDDNVISKIRSVVDNIEFDEDDDVTLGDVIGLMATQAVFGALEDSIQHKYGKLDDLAYQPELLWDTECLYPSNDFKELQQIISSGGQLSYLMHGISSKQVSQLLLSTPDEVRRVELAITLYGSVCDKWNWAVVYQSIPSFDKQLALEAGISFYYGNTE